MRERGADGAVRVDGLRLDVHRHGRGARERQRRRAARDQRRVQAVLQAVVLRAPAAQWQAAEQGGISRVSSAQRTLM